jgi:hypothetical protein
MDSILEPFDRTTDSRGRRLVPAVEFQRRSFSDRSLMTAREGQFIDRRLREENRSNVGAPLTVSCELFDLPRLRVCFSALLTVPTIYVQYNVIGPSHFRKQWLPLSLEYLTAEKGRSLICWKCPG